MTLVSHSLVAVAIASKITNPVIGLPIIFVSHFILDKVPHWDVMTDKSKSQKQVAIETSIDIVLGFLLAAAFWFWRPIISPEYLVAAVLVSQSPDLLEAPFIFPQINNPVSKAAYKIQHYIHDLWFDARLEAPWGIVTQVSVVGLFLIWSVL